MSVRDTIHGMTETEVRAAFAMLADQHPEDAADIISRIFAVTRQAALSAAQQSKAA